MSKAAIENRVATLMVKLNALPANAPLRYSVAIWREVRALEAQL